MVYASGAYGNGADPGNFYSTGIYRPFGDPSQYQGKLRPGAAAGRRVAEPVRLRRLTVRGRSSTP